MDSHEANHISTARFFCTQMILEYSITHTNATYTLVKVLDFANYITISHIDRVGKKMVRSNMCLHSKKDCKKIKYEKEDPVQGSSLTQCVHF